MKVQLCWALVSATHVPDVWDSVEEASCPQYTLPRIETVTEEGTLPLHTSLLADSINFVVCNVCDV
jgi:hypothetical protein